MEINKIYHENCLETLNKIPNDYLDLIVTSPPYYAGKEYEDSLITSEGYYGYVKFLLNFFEIIPLTKVE